MAVWDIDTLKEVILEGWDLLSVEKTINPAVHSMPQRWQDVIDANGQLTAW